MSDSLRILVGFLILSGAFIATILMWLLASIYDEGKCMNERHTEILRRRSLGIGEFYCPDCGELLDPEDPGDDCVEQYYCDCGFYATK